MPDCLARLRMDLDLMPSPLADRPGLLVRDPFHYSESTLIIPPLLAACLEHFDGTQTEVELRASLVRLTGELEVGEIVRHLRDTLSRAGFLEDAAYREMRQAAEQRFAAQPERQAIHAGSAYPEQPIRLTEVLDGYFRKSTVAVPNHRTPAGIAAPHVSPEGGWQCYAAAYAALSAADAGRTFIVLGTSHYGEPDRFGLTRKPFVTPFGEATTDTSLVDQLYAAAPESVQMEDYCHSVEHSIEFQVIFLQHLFGPKVRIVPILCGAFARSLHQGGYPEDTAEVAHFLDALGELYARGGQELCFVLGIDMAHIGRRYGDDFVAKAGAGRMQEVEACDRARIEQAGKGDRAAFWSLVQPNGDELKWCGSAPLYTFLKVVPGVRGELHRYQQWNIDDASVVSFGALSFYPRED